MKPESIDVQQVAEHQFRELEGRHALDAAVADLKEKVWLANI